MELKNVGFFFNSIHQQGPVFPVWVSVVKHFGTHIIPTQNACYPSPMTETSNRFLIETWPVRLVSRTNSNIVLRISACSPEKWITNVNHADNIKDTIRPRPQHTAQIMWRSIFYHPHPHLHSARAHTYRVLSAPNSHDTYVALTR